MRSHDEYETVHRLIAAGMDDLAIARHTEILRRTVHDWRRGRFNNRRRHSPGPCIHDFTGLPAPAYGYLLGMYLGDGCLSKHPRAWCLRITLDAKYPAIIQRCRDAINTVMADQRAGVVRRKSRCVDVYLYSQHWPCLFLSTAPDSKHLRSITLQPWQIDIVKQEPRQFVRGLIESDGCRVVANDRGVASIRYHFTNHSADIRGLFCWALDLLNIHWTQNSRYMIAVYRKADTARLDEFIGPKR